MSFEKIPQTTGFFIAAPLSALAESVSSLVIWHLLFPDLRQFDHPSRNRRAFIAQFLGSCVVAPIVEEALKMRAASFNPTSKVHTKLMRCVAASVGLKFADLTRRVSLYSRPWNPSPRFFAAARGLFPVHELTASLTATGGIVPAMILHGSANFRGMKPVGTWSFDSIAQCRI